MSTTPKRGRKPAPARTERGRLILAELESQGLTLQAAARKARIALPVLRNAIHGEPSRLSVRTVAQLCTRLNLPLRIVAPSLASSVTSSSS